VVRSGDIVYPPNGSVTGLVSLKVSVDATGAVRDAAVLRGQPPLTATAQEGVKKWKYAPAVKDGRAVAGEVRVYVVFSPFNPGDVSIASQPLDPQVAPSGTTDSGVFHPAEMKTATNAVYPPNTVASGTVVLDVKVAADGSVEGTRVLGGEAGTPLSGAATRAMRGWALIPGSYGGQAVLTHVSESKKCRSRRARPAPRSG
jgi:TonB family protein